MMTIPLRVDHDFPAVACNWRWSLFSASVNQNLTNCLNDRGHIVRDAMTAVLDNDLSPACRKPNQIQLKLMYPNFVKHFDFGVCLLRTHGDWLSSGQNDYRKVAKFARCACFIGAPFPGVAARRSD
jgi:hypothetical protein